MRSLHYDEMDWPWRDLTTSENRTIPYPDTNDGMMGRYVQICIDRCGCYVLWYKYISPITSKPHNWIARYDPIESHLSIKVLSPTHVDVLAMQIDANDRIVLLYADFSIRYMIRGLYDDNTSKWCIVQPIRSIVTNLNHSYTLMPPATLAFFSDGSLVVQY